MRVLIVASYNRSCFAPFVTEQVAALRQAGCTVECFGVQGKGLTGYLRAIPRLREQIQAIRPDVIHAHYGLCGLLANLAVRSIPVVTTYHGSDIHQPSVRLLSKIAMRLSAWNIFVSPRLMDRAHCRRRNSVIPCGVDLTDETWRGDEPNKVLFAGAFDNAVKDAPLALEAMKGIDAELVELKGYTRQEVNGLLCSVRCLLMTSRSEGSPQIIKEALVCGCPIVSVDVGDVRRRIEGVANCYIAPRDPQALHETISAVRNERTNGREKIIADGLTNSQVAKKIMDIYANIVRPHR